MANRVHELSIREGYETAARYPLATSGRGCGAKSPWTITDHFYKCTREPGHDGPHVAHVPGPSAVATWDSRKKVTRG